VGDGFPERYHVVDLKVSDRVVGAALWIGRLFTRQMAHESSLVHPLDEHYDNPDTTRMAQMKLNYDGDGREVLEDIVLSAFEEF
jgi:hypothetical protein